MTGAKGVGDDHKDSLLGGRFTLTPSRDSGQALAISRQRRICDPSRDLCVTAILNCHTNQIV